MYNNTISKFLIYAAFPILLTLSLIGDTSAATFTVNQTHDAGDLTCDATCTLRDAILDANATAGSDTIVFDPVVFGTPQTITLAGTVLTINQPTGDTLTITGPGANLLTVSGNNASRVFAISAADTAVISNMTITEGNSLTGAFPGFGGGIYSEGNLTLNNLVITGNSATNDGGGVYNSTSDTLTINNCIITNNTAASQSGGVHNHTGAFLTITNSTISGNTASGSGSGNGGGGIYSEDSSTLSISGSVISNNIASASSGGGILADSVTFTMTTTTISGNSAAGVGGGIAFDVDSTVDISRSTISGNTATSNGGGLHFQPDSNNIVSVTNSTVSGNSALNGGGIFRSASATLTVTLSFTTVVNNVATGTGGGINGTMNLNNTLVADNAAAVSADYAGTLNSQDHNLVEDITGTIFSGTTTNNITGQDPNLGALANNGGPTQTHALLVGSVAIDAGDPASSLTEDQRGMPRPINGDGVGGAQVDIGAFERMIATSAPVSISGRVSFRDRSIKGAQVIAIGANGEAVSTQTNNFGRFKLAGLRAGGTYTLMVSAKSYTFTPLLLQLDDSISGLEIQPESSGRIDRLR